MVHLPGTHGALLANHLSVNHLFARFNRHADLRLDCVSPAAVLGRLSNTRRNPYPCSFPANLPLPCYSVVEARGLRRLLGTYKGLDSGLTLRYQSRSGIYIGQEEAHGSLRLLLHVASPPRT